MKPPTFLRIASVLTLVHAVLHTIGGVFGKVAPGAQEVALLAMKTNQFKLMGLTRSYWDFQLGLGLAVSIFLLIEGIVFWQLGSLAKNGVPTLRPILVSFLAAYVALAVISYEYIFAGPMIGEILIALCLGAAIVTSRSAGSAYVRQPSGDLESVIAN